MSSVIIEVVVAAVATMACGESFQSKVEESWSTLFSAKYGEKTGLLYGTFPKNVKSASEFKDGIFKWEKGIKGGYGQGMGDTTLVGGVSLSMLCDRYAVLKDEYSAKYASKLARGLFNVATVPGHEGFVARGICYEDGRSICSLSSIDQVTHWYHGLWRYYRSPMCTDSNKAEIRRLFELVLHRILKEATPENNYAFLQADGTPDPRGICGVWGNVNPHCGARLVSFIAATWDVTGKSEWKNLYEKYIDESLEKSLVLTTTPSSKYKGIMPTYSILQMNSSLEVIRGVEKNMERIAKVDKCMARGAEIAEERALDMKANPGKKWYGMSPDAEIALSQLMAPAWKFNDTDIEILRAKLDALKISDLSTFDISHFAAAYWRARVRGIEI